MSACYHVPVKRGRGQPRRRAPRTKRALRNERRHVRGVLFADMEAITVRAFARAFYESPAWRRTRAYIFKRDAGLCVRCGAPGVIVHHIQPLTPANIDDPSISLNEDNLETLCRACHAIAHGATPPLADGLAFDEYGNVVEASLAPELRVDDDEYF